MIERNDRTGIVKFIITDVYTSKTTKYSMPIARIINSPSSIQADNAQLGVYFSYYSCILTSSAKTYVRLPELAYNLGEIFIVENLSDFTRIRPVSGTYVIGATAFSQLKWRAAVSAGVCWDSQGRIGLLGTVFLSPT